MANIKISDMTMKQAAEGFSLSFKEKIELAKLLDKLGVDVIELEGVENPRVDSLRIKSIAAAVKTSTVAVPVSLNMESVQEAWNALQAAVSPRLQAVASVSAVQMEYLYHKKPDAMIAAIADIVKACAQVCKDVEFVAEDATRSEFSFLCKAVETAISAGATTVTLCDTAASLLPQEFAEFVNKVAEAVPRIKNICLGVRCSDDLNMAVSASVAALTAGAGEVKTAAYPIGTADLAQVAKIIAARGDNFG
jgi:2-isopropylmalate synthase